MSVPKILVLVGWAAAIAAALIAEPGSTVQRGGLAIVGLLLVAHAAECLIFLPRLRRSGRPLGGQLLQVMIFGVTHVATLKD